MAHKGKYVPKYPAKYVGNVRQIVFRSGYELKFFRYCDYSKNVLAWSSEDVIIPYRNPITGEFHRYFVDIYIKHRLPDGTIKETLIEIKPASQCRPPEIQKRKTKRYLKEVETYVINKAKWTAADKYARKRGMTFCLFSERELGIHK
jgi:hypothetical protein